MSRVSENSSTNAIAFSVSKTKAKLEDLQIKGANLKKLQKPSDDPIGNAEVLSIRSMKADSQQYVKNANFTKAQLEFTENAISDLTDIVMKAKEIAVAQSSSIYNEDIRKNVAEEINQMRMQAIGVANRRLGNRYLFSGHKTLTAPFTERGNYQGDNGKSFVEVGKDFFVESNINGLELLGVKGKPKAAGDETKINLNPDPSHPEMPVNESLSYPQLERSLASSPEIMDQKPNLIDQSESKNLFNDLESLKNGLITDNTTIIQSMLDRLDDHLTNLVGVRTRLGAVANSIENNINHSERDLIIKEDYKSKIEDADVAELYSDMARQQATLDATYKSSSQLLNNSLLNFLK